MGNSECNLGLLSNNPWPGLHSEQLDVTQPENTCAVLWWSKELWCGATYPFAEWTQD